MQTITSRPETERSSTDPAAAFDPTPGAMSHADLALIIAILAPLAIVGLLVLVGLGIGAAVCIMFVLVFAVTTAMDVRWLLYRRRSRRAPCRSQS
jgi:Flp pilus assembly protein TadB